MKLSDIELTKNLKTPKQNQERYLYVQERRAEMDSKRTFREDVRREAELQVESRTVRKKDGNVVINIPIEQVIIETYIGMQQKLQFKVDKEGGEIDPIYLEVYKTIFDNFYWKREEVHKQIRKYRFDKAMY